MELSITETTLGTVPGLDVAGEIDLSTLPGFRSALARLVRAHPGVTVAVDLDGVYAIDDTGLGVLLGTAGTARERGGELVVVCTDEKLLQRFALTGLDRAITVVATSTALS